MQTKIALVGDYDAAVTAHQAIPRALELASLALALEAEPEWIGSDAIAGRDLAEFDALWCVPASPYRDQGAVIAAIAQARAADMPFLGTCAGYQHALIEYARNQLGYSEADSSEDNPEARLAVISALACRLDDQGDAVNLAPGSRLEEIYQSRRVVETYHCGYGFNPDYLSLFVDSGLVFSGFDDRGAPRAFELPQARFFVGTAFQPERSALQNATHPLIIAFLMAAG